LVDGSGAWTETAIINGVRGAPITGSGSDADFLWGFYVAGNASLRLSERWSATAGIQYQSVGTYSHFFGGRGVELDMSKSIFVTVGLTFNF
jgi:hypothetical protein